MFMKSVVFDAAFFFVDRMWKELQ